MSLHGSEFSNQIDCNDLVGPIALHVIFWLMPGVKFGEKNCFGRKNCFPVLSTLSRTSTWWIDFWGKCNT